MSLTKSFTAATAATFALATFAHADESTISYNLLPGTCTKPIAVPANNKPVNVSGTNITHGDRGIAQASLLRANATSPLLAWVGLDVTGSVTNNSSSVGTHIVFLDNAGFVDLSTAASTHIQICNAVDSGAYATGYLTFTY